VTTKEYYWKNREQLLTKYKSTRLKNLEKYRKSSRERNQKSRLLNPEPFRVSAKKHYHAHKDKHKEWSKKYYETHKIQIKSKIKSWDKLNREKMLAYQKRHREKVKQIVLSHYGGKCACCGEPNMAFLCLDHVNGGGNNHRKQFVGSIYEWVIKNKYPVDPPLQVLCYNCNSAKEHLGTCPHKNKNGGEVPC
jgi:hypothetical protein